MRLVSTSAARRLHSPHVCAGALALIVVCLVSGALSAETRSSAPVFVGLRLGYVPDDIGAFSGRLCTRKEQLFEWVVGVRPIRMLALQADLAYHDDFDATCAVEAPEPPVPEHGAFTRRAVEFADDIRKYPYYSSEIDLVAEPVSPGLGRFPVSLRAIAGYGRIWTKDIPFWTAGVGFAYGTERVRFVADLRKCWFEVPYERVDNRYQDGVLVDREAIPQHTNEHPLAIAAGIELGVPIVGRGGRP
jgi:hypothetical protein